ncbi:MAG: hypothetical protein QTN59_16835 [Candidatus Electrothrix communis]|nr:MAG: hypothetical protein QTN59_16835 [Candidatus Electrothrix communis]
MKITIEPIELNGKDRILQKYSEIEQFLIKESVKPPIKEIWVPNDFDRKVNELQGANDYASSRGEYEALAKNIYFPEEIETSIVFSTMVR